MKCMTKNCEYFHPQWQQNCLKVKLKTISECVYFTSDACTTIGSFDDFVDQQCDKIKSILKSKAGEYAKDSDRLHNFNMAANINNTSPEKALWGMAAKHLVSVIDLVNGDLERSRKNLDAKIVDMQNYLMLLHYMLIKDSNG